MAGSNKATETGLDIGAILDEALQNETFKGRRLECPRFSGVLSMKIDEGATHAKIPSCLPDRVPPEDHRLSPSRPPPERTLPRVQRLVTHDQQVAQAG